MYFLPWILTNTAFDLALILFFDTQGPFEESITAWEEAANIKHQDQKTAQKDKCAVEDELIVKTQNLIGAHTSSGLSSHCAHSLKNTIHLKALSTALQMARSHHALAVEAVIVSRESLTAASEESLDLFRVAIGHHLCALRLLCEIRRLRTASNKTSLDRKKFGTRFKGAAKKIILANRVTPAGGRLTASGRDIGVVSYDRNTHIQA